MRPLSSASPCAAKASKSPSVARGPAASSQNKASCRLPPPRNPNNRRMFADAPPNFRLLRQLAATRGFSRRDSPVLPTRSIETNYPGKPAAAPTLDSAPLRRRPRPAKNSFAEWSDLRRFMNRITCWRIAPAAPGAQNPRDIPQNRVTPSLRPRISLPSARHTCRGAGRMRRTRSGASR